MLLLDENDPILATQYNTARSVFAYSILYLLQKLRNLVITNVPEPLKIIDFNYSDELTNHNWKLVEGKLVTYTHGVDGHWGNVITIIASDKYALDLDISAEAKFCSSIKVIFKATEGTSFYLLSRVPSKSNSATKEIWFKFSDGVEPPRRISDKEWQIFIKAERLDGGWLQGNVDLYKVAEDTLGKEGWDIGKLELKKVRLRGNLSIAQIAFYE